MQVSALSNLERLRMEGKNRAIVISSTGSGKTYLSAFDAKIYGGKYLYVVHRRPILDRSMKSFRKVLGPEPAIEKYDPETNNISAQYTFTTIQTLSKPEVLSKIPPKTFDYILIDEVHHAGAFSYQRVIDHFKPRFMVGMTATPDRMDGYDIYGLFGYNIAYDIRLKEAMEYKLICPFHYFGIHDLEIDGKSYDNKSAFTEIEEEQRVNHILEQAEFYGYSGDRVRGVVFCSRIVDAELYSRMFNQRGYRTATVCGTTDKAVVDACIENLEADEGPTLDYIFTADLFNEGVDIPSVNQIIMLRPTESPIVYLQQLGRGLRLHENKEFLVVLDFIGNYEKNYNIPIALSDDRTYNKAEMRRFVEAGNSIIPGNSTVSFDEVSKRRIYESIDSPTFGNKKTIFEEYSLLKRKLGRIPLLSEFTKYGSIDAGIMVSEYRSYHEFLKTKEREYRVSFSKEKEDVLKYLSKIIVPGKRLREIEILEEINRNNLDIRKWAEKTYSSEGRNAVDTVLAVFDGSFYGNTPALISDTGVNQTYTTMLSDSEFRKHVEDIIMVGRENNAARFEERYRETDLVLYRQYNYDDVCRMLNWGRYVVAQNVGGYKFDEKTNTFPIFINYNKGEDVVESQKYEDKFESRSSLIGVSKSTEDAKSKNMQRVADSEKNGTVIHLFVRKNKDDRNALEFYYLGTMQFDRFVKTDKPCKIRYRLMSEIRADLYEYLVN